MNKVKFVAKELLKQCEESYIVIELDGIEYKIEGLQLKPIGYDGETYCVLKAKSYNNDGQMKYCR